MAILQINNRTFVNAKNIFFKKNIVRFEITDEVACLFGWIRKLNKRNLGLAYGISNGLVIAMFFLKKNVIHECIKRKRPYMYIKANWQKIHSIFILRNFSICSST